MQSVEESENESNQNNINVDPKCYKIHVDASLNEEKTMGRIAWVVYLDNEHVCTSVLTHVRATNINNLEKLVFVIANQIYEGAKIYTDNAGVWNHWKGKNKNRIYLIDTNDNLADMALAGKNVPKIYPKPPTYRFEYIRVKEE